MMTRWGISANSHNAALSVFVGDRLVFASSSERYSKLKNDAHLCKALVDEAMWWGKPHEIYWYENPKLKSYRQFLAGQKVPKGENNIRKYNYKCKNFIFKQVKSDPSLKITNFIKKQKINLLDK